MYILKRNIEDIFVIKIYIYSHKHNRCVSPTCPQPRHPRRRVSVVKVARPQLPVAVPAPALDAAARQQRARMAASRAEGDDACHETQREARRLYFIFISTSLTRNYLCYLCTIQNNKYSN